MQQLDRKIYKDVRSLQYQRVSGAWKGKNSMIMIPTSHDLQSLAKYSLDEIILFVLTLYPATLSIREISQHLKNLWGRQYSYKGIKKALKMLCDRGVVLENKKDKTLPFRYSLNLEVVERSKAYLEQVSQLHGKLNLILRDMNKDLFAHEVMVHSLVELESFLDELEFYWFEHMLGKENIIVYEQKFNLGCVLPVVHNPAFSRKVDITYYVVCESEGFNLRKKEGKWVYRKVFIRQGVPLDTSWDTRVFGDYVVNIQYPKAILDQLEKIFSKEHSGSESIAQELWNIKGDVVIKIRKDTSSSNQIRRQILQKFSESGFRELIQELKEQKSQGKELMVDNRFLYVLKEQVDLINATQTLVDARYTAFGLLTDTGLRLFNDYFMTEIKKYFKEDHSVAVVDLGVGPCVKPITILPKLTTMFKNIEYIGVDYSKKVLDAAQKHVSRYGFSEFKPKFVQLNLEDLSFSPNLLSSYIVSKQRVFLFMGGTYGNFSPERCRAFFSKILQPGDIFIIDKELINSKEELAKILPRYNEEYSTFSRIPLYELGFSKEDLKTVYRFNEGTMAVEEITVIKNIPENLPPEVKEIGLQVGDRIKTFVSRKPTAVAFEGEMKNLSNSVELSLYNEDNYYIAFGYVR